mgnify:CR=1 FL=1
MFTRKPLTVPEAASALPGRDTPLLGAERHTIYPRDIQAPCPEGFEEVWLGLGCFWGAERKFWQTQGVWLTAVGYAGGSTPNPTYREVCSGQTGHTEAVRVVYDPKVIDLDGILKVFWETHNPTQGMRQGNDVGTQYRSAIYTLEPTHLDRAQASRDAYQSALMRAGHEAKITTEIAPAAAFYYAEADHQQYLDKNPNGYCGLGGTGVACPIGLGAARSA